MTQDQKMESLILLAQRISHDFKSTLGLVIGHASIIQRMDERKIVNIHEQAQIIRNTAQKSVELIDQILAFGASVEYNPESINIEQILHEAVELIQNENKNSNFKVNLNLTLNTDRPKIIADPQILKKVFLNILINAVEAQSQNQEIIINIRLQQKEKNYELSFEDYGSGIDPSSIDQVFEPFYSTKGGVGRGLGLTYVYGALKQINGHITIESIPFKSTQINLSIPIVNVIY